MAKKKASPAQRAWRKEFGRLARAGKLGKANPKGKKRKNPKVVVRVKKEMPEESHTLSWPNKAEVEAAREERDAARAQLAAMQSEYDSLYSSPFSRDFVLSKSKKNYSGSTNKLVAVEKKLAALERKVTTAKEKYEELVTKRKGTIVSKKNSGKKRRKHKRNPGNPDYGIIVAGNPKKKKAKKKKAKKKKAKKAKKRSYKRKSKRRKALKALPMVMSHSFPLSKKRKAGISRRRRLRAKVSIGNPGSAKDMLMKYGVVALAGAAYPWYNYAIKRFIVKGLDDLTKGAVSRFLGPIDAKVPGVTAPGIALAVVLGLKIADDKWSFMKKLGAQADMAEQVLDTMGILAAAELGRVGAAYAKIDPVGAGMSGVDFYPSSMAGADFGYLTDGYRQRAGDFGNVKFFPAGMAGVEFYPPGSQGDQMYVPSMRDQLREAEGLGETPEMGGIPEGLGEIPEGMGEDPGQMG